MTARVVLLKPPERACLDFDAFNLAALGAYVRDIAPLRIVDATGLSLKEALERVAQGKPSVIGLTATSFESVGPAVKTVRALRRSGFHGRIFAGGHGAAMLPRDVLDAGADAVVYGEGEATFRELLLSGAAEEVRGLLHLRRGELVRTPPRPHLRMDTLPTPLRELTGRPPEKPALLETSRGCPHRCAFCETSRFHGGRWRARSPGKVARDVRGLLRQGATIIQIADDNFLADPGRAARICGLLAKGPLPLSFVFSARCDDLARHADLVPLLARANFLRVNVGVETADQDLSRSMGKRISLRQHQQAFAAMRAAGMYVVASFIVGLPGETPASRRESLAAAVELTDTARFVPFQPYPGLPIGDGSGRPHETDIERAERLTAAFERHPAVLRRKQMYAREISVRGLLARASLRSQERGAARRN